MKCKKAISSKPLHQCSRKFLQKSLSLRNSSSGVKNVVGAPFFTAVSYKIASFILNLIIYTNDYCAHKLMNIKDTGFVCSSLCAVFQLWQKAF